MDVLRAVCGPADVTEAELDRVRREATEKAESMELWGEWWEEVWRTEWMGVTVTAQV